MSGPPRFIKVKDEFTFVPSEADLTQKLPEETLDIPPRVIPYSYGFEWRIMFYPNGAYFGESEGTASIFFKVNKPAKMRVNVFINGGSPWESGDHEYTDSSDEWGFWDTASLEILLEWIRDEGCSITCAVEFEIAVPYVELSAPRLFPRRDQVPTDFELIIESKKLPVHRGFLSLLFPVFHAMTTHDTVESRRGKLVILDFDFETVKASIDFCYGEKLLNQSIENVVGILRFADKYVINAVIAELDDSPLLNLSVDTICPISHYAFDCAKDELLSKCCLFLKDNLDEIKTAQKFAELPPKLVIHLLRTAFGLNTDFDVLHHTHNNGISFIVAHLERPLIESMTLHDLCPAVQFAWEYDRDELKKTCAIFVNENYVEVMMLENFFQLPSEFFQGVLKLGYDLKCSTK